MSTSDVGGAGAGAGADKRARSVRSGASGGRYGGKMKMGEKVVSHVEGGRGEGDTLECLWVGLETTAVGRIETAVVGLETAERILKDRRIAERQKVSQKIKSKIGEFVGGLFGVGVDADAVTETDELAKYDGVDEAEAQRDGGAGAGAGAGEYV